MTLMSVPIDSITEDHLRSLIDDQVAELRIIEYKRDPVTLLVFIQVRGKEVLGNSHSPGPERPAAWVLAAAVRLLARPQTNVCA